VDRLACVHARIGATAACCTAFLRNATSGRLFTRGFTGLAHFRAQFTDASGELRLAHHKIRARLTNLGTVFRRLYRPGIHAAARLQRRTAFLALSTSFDALLHFLRNRLVRHANPLRHLVPLLSGPYQHFGVFERSNITMFQVATRSSY
jgi:hypothetical protein